MNFSPLINNTPDYSSDSDNNDIITDKYSFWKFRLHLLICLSVISRYSSKLFYGYWDLFIPSTTNYQHNNNILNILLNDPSSKVRSQAANTLISILDGSRNYLSIITPTK